MYNEVYHATVSLTVGEKPKLLSASGPNIDSEVFRKISRGLDTYCKYSLDVDLVYKLSYNSEFTLINSKCLTTLYVVVGKKLHELIIVENYKDLFGCKNVLVKDTKSYTTFEIAYNRLHQTKESAIMQLYHYYAAGYETDIERALKRFIDDVDELRTLAEDHNLDLSLD